MRKYQVRFRGGITEKEHSYLAGILPDTSDGRKLALDQRLINPDLPDDPGSKVNACVENVYRIWLESAGQRSAQLIFSDLSTPAGKKPLEAKQKEDGTFEVPHSEFTDVYNDIRSKLIAKGIPESEIAYIHDANTDARKAELFGKVRSGTVRILLGSTSKMGAGTNVQRKLIALHHLDVPWRPREVNRSLQHFYVSDRIKNRIGYTENPRIAPFVRAVFGFLLLTGSFSSLSKAK